MNKKYLLTMFVVQVLTLVLICASVNLSIWFPIIALWVSGILIGISVGEILQEHNQKRNEAKDSQKSGSSFRAGE
ncbi:hypothetical protein F924_00973 [Acinetobacter lwoffii ATCC 9957 = CIP 70.31]|nr:hypothetical protein F924_00973 [Acinetobacter lwoffii ATCC 9957 = CIP 70.31]